jgi:anti-anti-sigma regulatory factor
MLVNRIDTDTETTLVFEASARIAEAEVLKADLGQVLDSRHPLVSLDFTAVDSTDATLFQLVLALQKSLKDQGRHLILRPLPDDHVVSETARLLGLPLAHHFTLVEASR